MKIATAIAICFSDRMRSHEEPDEFRAIAASVNLAGTWISKELTEAVIEFKATLAFCRPGGLRAVRAIGSWDRQRSRKPDQDGPLAERNDVRTGPSDQDQRKKRRRRVHNGCHQDGKLLVYGGVGYAVAVSCRNGGGKQMTTSTTDHARQPVRGSPEHDSRTTVATSRCCRRQLRDSYGISIEGFPASRQVRRAIGKPPSAARRRGKRHYG